MLDTNGESIDAECQHRTGRLCFFKPVSNCNQQQIDGILDNAKRKRSVLVMDTAHCAAMYNQSIDTLSKFVDHTKDFKVIQYHHSLQTACDVLKYQQSMNKELTEHISEKYGFGVTYSEFNALTLSFLWRLQENMEEMVKEAVSASLERYNFSNSLSTISMAVRGSDKCWSHRRHGEMKCPKDGDRMKAVRALKDGLNQHIDAIIITSEDREVIEAYKDNVSLQFEGDFKFIFNDFDVTPNSGNPWELKQNANDSSLFNVDEDRSYYLLFLSMMSSIRLQMNAYSAVTQPASNWLHGIWSISKHIHCETDVDALSVEHHDHEHSKHCIAFSKHAKLKDVDQECERADRFDCNETVAAKQEIERRKRERLNAEKNISNAFCTYLMPQKTYYIAFQHKTGHIIGQHLFRYLADYCHQKGFVLELDNKPKTVQSLMNGDAAHQKVMIYHFSRDPVNTVLSGYNYWRKGMEGWVNRADAVHVHHDRRFIKFNFERNTTYSLEERPDAVTTRPYHCYLDEFILNSNFPFDFNVTEFEFAFNVNDTEQGVHWMLANNASISRWYQSMDLGLGVFQEFKRYFNCEFNDKYAVYQLIKKFHGENNKLHTFWNDHVRSHFEENIERFLDSINFVESKQNLELLQRHNVHHFNITAERLKFVELAQPLKENRKHSAGNLEQRDDQMRALLTINNLVCLTLKRMTKMISAPWRHTQYC